jgi:energy-converting hydrogenase Eha subunit F
MSYVIRSQHTWHNASSLKYDIHSNLHVLGQLTNLFYQLCGRGGVLTNVIGHLTNYVGHLTNYVGQLTNYVGQLTNYVGQLTNYVGQLTNYVGQLTNYVGQHLLVV